MRGLGCGRRPGGALAFLLCGAHRLRDRRAGRGAGSAPRDPAGHLSHGIGDSPFDSSLIHDPAAAAMVVRARHCVSIDSTTWRAGAADTTSPVDGSWDLIYRAGVTGDPLTADERKRLFELGVIDESGQLMWPVFRAGEPLHDRLQALARQIRQFACRPDALRRARPVVPLRPTAHVRYGVSRRELGDRRSPRSRRSG